jgi:hypothetical protein
MNQVTVEALSIVPRVSKKFWVACVLACLLPEAYSHEGAESRILTAGVRK